MFFDVFKSRHSDFLKKFAVITFQLQKLVITAFFVFIFCTFNLSFKPKNLILNGVVLT